MVIVTKINTLLAIVDFVNSIFSASASVGWLSRIAAVLLDVEVLDGVRLLLRDREKVLEVLVEDDKDRGTLLASAVSFFTDAVNCVDVDVPYN